jgi:hypothetical protein
MVTPESPVPVVALITLPLTPESWARIGMAERKNNRIMVIVLLIRI